MVERVMTISLRKYLSGQPRTKRKRKAIRYLRNRIAHYSSVDEENVKISRELNEMVVKHHAKQMSPVKLRVDIEKGIANAKPFEQKVVVAAAQSKQAAPKSADAKKVSQAKTGK
jgi:ribosomal protein L31E